MSDEIDKALKLLESKEMQAILICPWPHDMTVKTLRGMTHLKDLGATKEIQEKAEEAIQMLWRLPVRRSALQRTELLLASIPTRQLSLPLTGDLKDVASLVPDKDQALAKAMMLKERMVVVTGGPGTGKTTTLRQTLDECDRRGISYELAAPTGKAAIRIEETTGRTAQTIHRLLEYKPDRETGEMVFHRNSLDELTTDLVIIDEASMVDVWLGASLFDAINPMKTRVVFMGDVDQLPSVGAGQVLGDIIDSGKVPTVRLRTVHRAAAESWVCGNAPLVIRGEKPSLEPQKDFRFYERTDAHGVIRTVTKLVAQDKKDEEVQVLGPQNRGDLGIEPLNALLQSELNPKRAPNEIQWEVGPYKIRLDDRVIHCKNNYNLRVFNGEIGTVQGLDGEKMLVDYSGRLVTYEMATARDLKLAYALTIHKSQGSEWDWVIVICHSMHHYMLSRQLLYTAITRAKKGVILVGDEEGLEDALDNDQPRQRETTLRQRLVQVA